MRARQTLGADTQTVGIFSLFANLCVKPKEVARIDYCILTGR